MSEKLKLLERLKLRLSGHLYIGDQIREGWKESLPFYLFKCPIHGLVKSYPKGYSSRLECPFCLEEKISKKVEEKEQTSVLTPENF